MDSKFITIFTLVLLNSSAFAATTLSSTSQKGSLLIFPRVEALTSSNSETSFASDTLISITNDAPISVNVQCVWGTTEGSPYNRAGGNAAANSNAAQSRINIRNNHYMGFSFVLTKNQPAIFWAGDLSTATNGQYRLSSFAGISPTINVPPFTEFQDGTQATAGQLKCWAVNRSGEKEIHHNHLTGKATVVRFLPTTDTGTGQAYDYNAWVFQAHHYDKTQAFPSNSIHYTSKPLPTPGELNLDGKEYDQCPSALAGQFIPTRHSVAQGINKTALNFVNCHQDLTQDANAYITNLTYSVWNANETKYTGASECMGAWYESDLGRAFPHFTYKSLKTNSAYFRVQSTKSALCNQGSQKQRPESDVEVSGIVGIQVNEVENAFLTSSQLTGLSPSVSSHLPAGKGQILWDHNSEELGKK